MLVKLYHCAMGDNKHNQFLMTMLLDIFLLFSPGLTEPTDNCTAGYFCTLAAVVTNPDGESYGDVCPAGYYCPEGTIFIMQYLSYAEILDIDLILLKIECGGWGWVFFACLLPKI